jgi:hypothetical protein
MPVTGGVVRVRDLHSDYHQAFHDITTGSNTASFPHAPIPGYPAAPGWDPVTGLASPDAQGWPKVPAGQHQWRVNGRPPARWDVTDEP